MYIILLLLSENIPMLHSCISSQCQSNRLQNKRECIRSIPWVWNVGNNTNKPQKDETYDI